MKFVGLWYTQKVKCYLQGSGRALLSALHRSHACGKHLRISHETTPCPHPWLSPNFHSFCSGVGVHIGMCCVSPTLSCPFPSLSTLRHSFWGPLTLSVVSESHIFAQRDDSSHVGALLDIHARRVHLSPQKGTHHTRSLTDGRQEKAGRGKGRGRAEHKRDKASAVFGPGRRT